LLFFACTLLSPEMMTTAARNEQTRYLLVLVLVLVLLLILFDW
jgi:hypothetical protein